MNHTAQMLYEIGILDFTVIELTLYLDTHPHDRNAMEYFNHYNRLRNQLEKEFSQKYYPLTIEMADCDKSWKWGEAPLPWEGGCN